MIQIEAIFGQRYCSKEQFSEALTKIARNRIADRAEIQKSHIDLKQELVELVKSLKTPASELEKMISIQVREQVA